MTALTNTKTHTLSSSPPILSPQSGSGWSPVYRGDLDNLAVMSIGFMLPDPDDAVVWRGPRKNGLIKQFLRDVDWGDLDFLVVDAPPGEAQDGSYLVLVLYHILCLCYLLPISLLK